MKIDCNQRIREGLSNEMRLRKLIIAPFANCRGFCVMIVAAVEEEIICVLLGG
jgi:hypothetical protein